MLNIKNGFHSSKKVFWIPYYHLNMIVFRPKFLLIVNTLYFKDRSLFFTMSRSSLIWFWTALEHFPQVRACQCPVHVFDPQVIKLTLFSFAIGQGSRKQAAWPLGNWLLWSLPCPLPHFSSICRPCPPVSSRVVGRWWQGLPWWDKQDREVHTCTDLNFQTTFPCRRPGRPWRSW